MGAGLIPKKMCLYEYPGTGRTCNAISSGTYCPEHRTKQARGYGKEHEATRKAAMQIAPFCWKCGCRDCKLQWHHVTELRGGRNPERDDRRQLLCIDCHNKVKEH